MEWIGNGTLSLYLRQQAGGPDGSVNNKVSQRMSLDIVSALAYLAEKDIVHGNLTSR